MPSDLESLRQRPYDQEAFGRLMTSARGGNPESLAGLIELLSMPELRQRAVRALADLQQLEPLARFWAEHRDPIAGEVLARQGYVADHRLGMRVETGIHLTVLTALNCARHEQLWTLPERLQALVARELVEACGDPDLAGAAALALPDCPWFELLAAEVLKANAPQDARRLVVGDPRLPAHPGRRAVLLLLRDQHEEAELLDPDGLLLARACQEADDSLRLEVLSRLRTRGRTLQAMQVLGARSRRSFQEVLSALLVEGRYQDLWELAFHLPPARAGELLETLRAAGFVPEQDEGLWSELLALLPYQTPEPVEITLEGGGELALGPDRLVELTDTELWAYALDGSLLWRVARPWPRNPARLSLSSDGSFLALHELARLSFEWHDHEPGMLWILDARNGQVSLQSIAVEAMAWSNRGEVALAAGGWLAWRTLPELSILRNQAVPSGLLGLSFAVEAELLAWFNHEQIQMLDRGLVQDLPTRGETTLALPWAVSKSGERLAVATRTRVLLTGPETRFLPPGLARSLLFTPDDRLLVLSKNELRDAEGTLRAFPTPPRDATLSPDGHWLAWLEEDELVVEALTDRRQSLRLSAPGARKLLYTRSHCLAIAGEQAWLWPTALWERDYRRLEELSVQHPAYRFAALLARHRHRHDLVLDGLWEFSPQDIQLQDGI